MPRAGWCHECGEWVWLDPEGACPDGHGPECIVHEYDAEPTPDSDAPPFPIKLEHEHEAEESTDTHGVGEGPMPASMIRFNWGAFMVPAVWSMVYGVWPVLLAWITGALMLPLVLAIVAGMANPTSDAKAIVPVAWILRITVFTEAAAAFVRLWAGVRANELYWARETRRLSANPVAVAKVGTEKFLKRQRAWAIWGAVGLVVAALLTGPMNYLSGEPYGLQWAMVFEPLVFLAAQIVLAVWLSRSMSGQRPTLLAPTSEGDTDAETSEDAPGRRW
jgi:hypothetical protein